MTEEELLQTFKLTVETVFRYLAGDLDKNDLLNYFELTLNRDLYIELCHKYLLQDVDTLNGKYSKWMFVSDPNKLNDVEEMELISDDRTKEASN